MYHSYASYQSYWHDGRPKAANRVSSRRGGSLPVLLTARISRGLPKCSPGYEDSRRSGSGRDITVCESRRIIKCGCTGAFIFFSSSRNSALPRCTCPSASRTGAKPVDLETYLTSERSDLNPKSDRSDASVRARSDRSRDPEGSLGLLVIVIIAHVITMFARRSCREAILALNPSSQHHRSRPAVTNRSVRSNRSRNATRRSGGRGERVEEKERGRRKRRRTGEKDDRVGKRGPGTTGIFPAGLPTRRRHGHRRQHRGADRRSSLFHTGNNR